MSRACYTTRHVAGEALCVQIIRVSKDLGTLSVPFRLAVWGNPHFENPERSKVELSFGIVTGCFVFDLKENDEPQVIHTPYSGRLDADGRYLLLDAKNRTLIDFDTMVERSVAYDESVAQVSAEANAAVRRVEDQLVFPASGPFDSTYIDLIDAEQPREMLERSGYQYMQIYGNGACGVGIKDGRLELWCGMDEDPKSIQIGYAPSDILSLTVDGATASVFAYTPSAIHRYPLPAADMLRRLAQTWYDIRGITPDGAYVLTNEWEIESTVLREPETAEAVGVFPASQEWCVQQEGTSVASTGVSGEIAVYRLPAANGSHRMIPVLAEQTMFDGARSSFSRDAKWFVTCGYSADATGSVGKACHIVDLDSGDIVTTVFPRKNRGDREVYFSFTIDGESTVALESFGEVVPIVCSAEMLWCLQGGRLEAYEIATGAQVSLGQEFRADAAALSWHGKTLALVRGGEVSLVEMPSLERVATWPVPLSRIQKIAWGQNDQRLFLIGEELMSICDTSSGDVLLTIPVEQERETHVPRDGSSAFLAGRLCCTVPIRERWSSIERIDHAESDPREHRSALRDLSGLPLGAFDDSGELRQAVCDDASFSSRRKLAMLKVISEAQKRCAEVLKDHPIDKERQRVAVLGHGDGASQEFVDILLWLIDKGMPSEKELNNYAWELVADARRARSEYAAAFDAIERALERDRENPALLNTLGVSLYRIGRFSEAVEPLRQSEALISLDSNLIFMAMSKYQLGQFAEAEEILDRVRIKSRELDLESASFLREAEKLFATPPPPSLPE